MAASISRKVSSLVLLAPIALAVCGCATRGGATPQSAPGSASLTGAKIAPRIQRVLVADKGTVSMVARDGCVATISSAQLEAGPTDELRVRCPRPERLRTWFDGVDKLTAAVAFTPEKEGDDADDEDVPFPSAEIINAQGRTMRVSKQTDAERLAGEVRALAAELAAAEVPAPGPATPAGWQMLRVSGPAHVYFAGSPTRGVLEAKMSTTGQYFCEYLADTSEGPMRATKSGWLSPTIASRAIDEVLKPFEGLGESERPRTTFAAAVNAAGERQATVSATAAVFQRFAPVQDALGDACVPELDPPLPPSSQL